MTWTALDVALGASILLCGLVAGLVFGFAVVVIPGIAKLSNREFLRAFKRMDGIIQDKQPLFMLVWVGSILAVIATAIAGTVELSGSERVLVWSASAFYLLAVQGPTIRVNIPLNNAGQALEIESMSEAELAEARRRFEAPWNRWNRFRTWAAVGSVAAFLVLQVIR